MTQVMTDAEKVAKIKAVIEDKKKKKPVTVQMMNVVTEVDFK